jgi:glutamyl-tRNA synthetase
MIRTRFAPSPTGYLHVGGLRTALYSYLFAKKNGGKFLLRIEDTDRERFVADGTINILKSLQWAGIIPDEGVCLGSGDEVEQKGEVGPYIQSERLEIYKKYALELVEKGVAYYCFCTAERLEKVREEQQKNKLPTGYDGYCFKNFKPEEAKAKAVSGEKHVVRLKMPKVGETKFTDLIRGDVSFKNELIDDQVLVKSDGFPTYHLAVVVDDHLMDITHVIRGEEWISSTPKHIQLYKYFGWDEPKFAHLPLLLNSDKSKLSKRQGDVAVSDYDKKGYLPAALINFVAFLGWNPGGEREIFSLNELEKEFDFSKVNKTGAVFNLEKLDWFNKEYIKKLSVEEFVKKSEKYLPSEFKENRAKLLAAISLEKDRIKTMAELETSIKFLFVLPDYKKDLLVWRRGTTEEVAKVLPLLNNVLSEIRDVDWNRENIEKSVFKLISDQGLSNGSVLWPLRVSLSGQENSPGPFEIAEVLGKNEALKRLLVAISK